MLWLTTPWLLLIGAGLLEVVWASLLPATHGFTRVVPSLVLVAFLALSMLGVAIAARTIPIGTAYGIWVGIGAAGTAVVGIMVYGEPVTWPRIAFLALLVVSVVGLRATATH